MQNNNKKEKYIDVRVTYDFRVDISDFDPEHVDIDGLAIDLTKREIDTLNSEDFNYKIISRSSKIEDYIKLISDDGFPYDPYIDIDGIVISKTPELNAFTYDRFCLWRSAKYDKTCKFIDSSEMWKHNDKLFYKIFKYIFRNNHVTFIGEGVSDIERFLNMYFGTIAYKIKLFGIEQGCQNLNPYWYFYVKLEPNEGFDDVKTSKFIDRIMDPNTDRRIALEDLYGDIL